MYILKILVYYTIAIALLLIERQIGQFPFTWLFVSAYLFTKTPNVLVFAFSLFADVLIGVPFGLSIVIVVLVRELIYRLPQNTLLRVLALLLIGSGLAALFGKSILLSGIGFVVIYSLGVRRSSVREIGDAI